MKSAYGLASKDTTPGQIVAVYDNLKAEVPKSNFTIGIEDDVTLTSLHYKDLLLDSPGQTACKIWGIGGDGTVGANKNAITTIGLMADKYAQAYFAYDSMKSGGLTQSHLRFGDRPIRATYLVSSADFVGCYRAFFIPFGANLQFPPLGCYEKTAQTFITTMPNFQRL